MQIFMNPLINSLLGTVFILVGIAAVWVMLSLKGAPKERPGRSRLIWLHRALGIGFTLIFFWMITVMILKVIPFKGQWGIRSSLHTVLAFMLLGVLMVKIAIAKRYTRLTHLLPGLGIACFSLAIALVAITGGYYFMHTNHVKYVRFSPQDADLLDASWGEQLTRQKCGECHSLERVFASFKSQEGWERTVNRMAVTAAPLITDFDVKQIINFLVIQQKRRMKEDGKAIELASGETLVEQKCSQCHNLERVFSARKNKPQWFSTMDRMTKHRGDPNFLTTDQRESIAFFLVNRGEDERE